MRLNKRIAMSGLCSRRKADTLISSGAVTVNGALCTELATQVEMEDRITVHGKALPDTPERKIYVFHKPVGYVCSHGDNHGAKSIYELLPENVNLHSVGRLDKDTSGLLLVTNDGQFTERVAHPRTETDKIYRVTLRTPLSDRQIETLQNGVTVPQIEDEPSYTTRPADVNMTKDPHIVFLTIHEGKKRQVRRMLEAIGNEVVALHRVQIGTLSLGDLEEASYRTLTPEEEHIFD